MGDSVEGQPAIKIFLYNLLKKNICLLVCCKGPDKKKSMISLLLHLLMLDLK